jgi:hypothetical protein
LIQRERIPAPNLQELKLRREHEERDALNPGFGTFRSFVRFLTIE